MRKDKVACWLSALFGCATWVLILTGCGDCSKTRARQLIVDRFGTTEVIEVPEAQDIYVVRDTNGVIWIVNTLNFSSGSRTTNHAATKIFDAK